MVHREILHRNVFLVTSIISVCVFVFFNPTNSFFFFFHFPYLFILVCLSSFFIYIFNIQIQGALGKLGCERAQSQLLFCWWHCILQSIQGDRPTLWTFWCGCYSSWGNRTKVCMYTDTNHSHHIHQWSLSYLTGAWQDFKKKSSPLYSMKIKFGYQKKARYFSDYRSKF